MKTGSWGIRLNCSIVIPVWRSWNVLYWRSVKSITLKINDQTFKYRIKVQVLKDTSWMKPPYLARFFLCLKCQATAVVLDLLRDFVLLNYSKRGVAFRIAGWMKNGLCRKWICCSNPILLKLNTVCSHSHITWRWVRLNEQWPSG